MKELSITNNNLLGLITIMKYFIGVFLHRCNFYSMARFLGGMADVAAWGAVLSIMMKLFPNKVARIVSLTEMFFGLGYMLGKLDRFKDMEWRVKRVSFFIKKWNSDMSETKNNCDVINVLRNLNDTQLKRCDTTWTQE